MFHSQLVRGTPNSGPVLSEHALCLLGPGKSQHCCGVECEGCSLMGKRPMTFPSLFSLHCQHTLSLERCLLAGAMGVGGQPSPLTTHLSINHFISTSLGSVLATDVNTLERELATCGFQECNRARHCAYGPSVSSYSNRRFLQL